MKIYCNACGNLLSDEPTKNVFEINVNPCESCLQTKRHEIIDAFADGKMWINLNGEVEGNE